jgi:predicted amidophosphoribosyltransferase
MTPQARALALIFPPQCLSCGDPVQDEGGLCGPCWRDTPFILGLCCDLCGAPLPGASDVAVTCDDCRARDRPWARGRAVMLYRGGGRRLVLGLKHADRLDLAPAMAGWMAARAGPLIAPDTLVAPVPAHWWRFFRRRYNQAAVLAQALGARTCRPAVPDLLLRRRATKVQDGMGPDARYANLADAITVNPRHCGVIAGRPVMLVDDVMTSGATLDACARACLAAGAAEISVMVLARVTRDG